MVDEAPDPARLMKVARQALTSAEYRRKFHMADFWGLAQWYEPQLRFFAAGAKHHQRLIRGGNQTGKSFPCAYEAAVHMTGQYPRWWIGKRFDRPTRGWIVGPERTLVRDGPQRKMTAMQGEFGTGTIPLAAFAGKPVMVPGGTGSIDTMSVAHETDGTRDGLSTATFKSFEQGAEKMQSESVDWIWIDERCSEEIYSELVARTTATDGILFLSYTPLKGGGELTYSFLNEYSSDRVDIRIDVADAKHISAERRAQLEESYLPHEREARIHGIPQLGIARVFPFPIESLMRAFDPDKDIQGWAKWLVGIDFGYGHPFAAALCAWVPEIDEFFVVDGFKMERSEALYHVKRIAGMCRGLRIPIAWPHDGLTHEKGSGEALADVYRRLGAPMLGTHAENHGGGYHTEPAIEEMCGFMKRGAVNIASHMGELGEEILNYHRDEDYKIVRLRDDLISAVRYAFMMRRHGKLPDACESYGVAPGVDNGARYDPRPPRPDRRQTQFARGTPNHPDGAFDVFTGR
ncbi:MAG: terminase family protein [Xanthobacteraceae bacterium]